MKDLAAHMPDYGKGMSDIFTRLLPTLKTAKDNAEKALDAAKRTGTDNPTTHVHELVDDLQKLGESA